MYAYPCCRLTCTLTIHCVSCQNHFNNHKILAIVLRTMPAYYLPYETLEEIFDRVDQIDVLQCALVCRHWQPPAARSLWHRINFRIHPVNNLLVDLLAADERLFSNFIRTTEIHLNLSVVGPLQEAPTLATRIACIRNLEIFRRICSKLPMQMEKLSIRFEWLGWDFDADTEETPPIKMIELIDDVEDTLRPLSNHEFENVNIEYVPSTPGGVHPARLGVAKNVYLFKNSLTNLNICLVSGMKHSPPPMRRLKTLVLDSWTKEPNNEHMVKWSDLSHLQLESLSIRNNRLPDTLQLPKTITKLSLDNVSNDELIFPLAFLTLPNLEHLELRLLDDFNFLHFVYNSFEPFVLVEPNVRPIVSTKLKTLSVIHTTFDNNYFQYISLSCRTISTLRFTERAFPFMNEIFTANNPVPRLSLPWKSQTAPFGRLLYWETVSPAFFRHDINIVCFEPNSCPKHRAHDRIWEMTRIGTSTVGIFDRSLMAVVFNGEQGTYDSFNHLYEPDSIGETIYWELKIVGSDNDSRYL
jgi:F-box-like